MPEARMNTITIKSEKPIVAIPLEDYESMKETIELLSANPGLADELRKEREEMKKGHFISLSDFKKKYEVK
jgi:PHD/YefM family antitoxin component YafN of YafNO toxin-antitoxin module